MKPTEQPQRGLLTRLVADNLPLKILAVVLALALFSLVHSDQDAQRSLYVDVVALLPPPRAQKMLVSEIPTQVKITLRGSRARISALQPGDFAPIQMDLRDSGRRYFYFDVSALDLPGATQVVAIDPPAVELVWASSAERKVPIRVRLRGAPDSGYMIKKPVALMPPVVTIRGPAEEVKLITEVFTDDIAIDDIAPGAHDRRVQLEPLPGHVTYLDQALADVRLEIVPELGDRVLRRLDVAMLGDGSARARPATVAVTLRGSVRGLVDVEPDEVVPYVDMASVAAAGPGLVSAEVKVRGVPEGFEVVRVVPPTVLVQRKP